MEFSIQHGGGGKIGSFSIQLPNGLKRPEMQRKIFHFATPPPDISKSTWKFSIYHGGGGQIPLNGKFHLFIFFVPLPYATMKISSTKTQNEVKYFSGIEYFDQEYNIFCNLLWTCAYSLNFYFYCLINQDIRKISVDFIKRHFKIPTSQCYCSI